MVMSFLLPASAHEYTRCWLEENLHHLHTLLYTLYSHYSLLRTIEAAWTLSLLGQANCDCALPMADFFTPLAATTP